MYPPGCHKPSSSIRTAARRCSASWLSSYRQYPGCIHCALQQGECSAHNPAGQHDILLSCTELRTTSIIVQRSPVCFSMRICLHCVKCMMAYTSLQPALPMAGAVEVTCACLLLCAIPFILIVGVICHAVNSSPVVTSARGPVVRHTSGHAIQGLKTPAILHKVCNRTAAYFQRSSVNLLADCILPSGESSSAACNPGDEQHLVFECPALQGVRD